VLSVRPGDTISFCAGYNDTESVREPDAVLTVGTVTQERPMGVMTGGFSYVRLVVTNSVFSSIVGGLTDQQRAELPEQGSLQYSAFTTTDEDQRLEAQLSELLQTLPTSAYYMYNVKDAARSEQNLSTFLGVFVYGFIILISLICIANIFNTVSTNIALRRREFAMMRSVGMTPGGFNRMVRFESIFYGLKALLFGLPISVLISYGLYRLQQGVLLSGFTLPWQSYCFAVLMLLVVVFSTMLYSTHRIKKENIIDALKDENL
jgi:putative ABC transport system permease protein